MKSRLKQKLWIVLLAFFGLSYSSALSAQTEGKTGTTITIDKSSCHHLYSNGATGNWYSFIRHNIAHVQLLSANEPTLKSDGTGTFAQMANDLYFNDAEQLEVGNWAGHYSVVYLAVVAPKGYRFTRYQMEIDGSLSTAGTTVTQYTASEDTLVATSTNTTVAENMATWDVNLNNGTNVIYFCYDLGDKYVSSSSTPVKLYLKSLKLTYVIDQPFEATVPSTEGDQNIHTGLLDMGQFSDNGTHWAFDQTAGITDTQSTTLYNGTTEAVPEVATVKGKDGYFNVANAGGDYIVSAPEKFRIVGASLQFLKSDATEKETSTTTYTWEQASEITDGGKYRISTSEGYYLNANSGLLAYDNDAESATLWTFTKGDNGYYISGGGYYLCVRVSNRTLSLATSGTSYYWLWTLSDEGKLKNNSSGRYLYFNNTGWSASNNASSITLTQRIATTTITPGESYTGGNFTASVYDREDEAVVNNGTLNLTSENNEGTVTLTDLNNDAIHFNISGLADGQVALYKVNLKLLPLNPELQNLSVASKIGSDVIPNTTSFTSENFNFNRGNDVTVIVPSNVTETECSVVFRNAYNEEGTRWYDSGENENNTAKSTGGYSNYFLVNSSADNGGDTDVALNVNLKDNVPGDRVSSDMSGTEKLLFNNINKINDTDRAERLEDIPFSKTEAKYGEAKVDIDGLESKEFYIYTADMPTFNILKKAGISKKNIDFRYYTLKVICKKQKEEPEVELTPIYTSTLKSQNHKNTSISSDGDDMSSKVTFVGVKVKAKLAGEEEGTALGYLTSEQVVNAIKEALPANSQGIEFLENDVLRGVLYIDMSELKGVDNAQFTKDFDKSTADNCLYFMYQGFHRENVTNTIAKTSDGFEAIGNIKVYDQQPFFSPHDFKTGSFTVSYTREGTVQGKNTKATVKNMAVVLPFDVNLDGNGNLKSASDVVNNTVTYHNITGSGDLTSVRPGDAGELTYAVVAEPITGAVVAKANEPYYVTTTENGFTYNIAGAQFRATPNEPLTRTSGTWTAIGTYSGVQPAKDNQLWYFAKDYFWKSGNLTSTNVVDVRPFRAYFTTTDKTAESKAAVVFSSDDVVPTGIGSVAAGKSSLLLSVGVGTITATASSADTLEVYTLAGQLVTKSNLNAGQTLTVSVPKGVYIVNSVKVVVK